MSRYDYVLKEMTVGDMLDCSIEAYKQNFKKLSALAVIFYVPFMLIYGFIVSYLYGNMIDISEKASFENSAEMSYAVIAFYAAILGMGLLYAVYSLTIKGVMDASAAKIVYHSVVYRRALDLKSTIKECFKKFPALLLNRFLYYLMILGIGMGIYTAIIIVAAVILGISFGAAYTGIFSEGVPTIAGIALGIIAGIVAAAAVIAVILVFAYFYAAFGMGVQSIAIENKSGTEAFTRCNSLSKKSFWSISLTYIFGTLLFFSVPAMLSYTSQLLIIFDKALYIAANVLMQAVWAFLSPYLTTLLTVMFINQKIKTEGLDLEVKVDMLLEQKSKNENIFENGGTVDVQV